MSEFANELELQLSQAVQTGTLVGPDDSADPAGGAQWGPERTVRAELLDGLLTTEREGEAAPRALRLRGARISGRLDLESCVVRCPLVLQRCYFEQLMDLSDSQLPAVRLPGCHLPGLFGCRLDARGNVELDHGFTATGEVRLLGAHIGGQLSFTGATLDNAEGWALNADGMNVDQDMFCDESFAARGEVRLVGAHIGGQVSFSGASLANEKGPALNADGLNVDQDMLCRESFSATGEVRLQGAHIGGHLSFSGATLDNPGGRALNAEGLTVDRSMFCVEGFSAKGEIALLGGRIRGQLGFSDATLENEGGAALSADSLTVNQGMFCNEGFSAKGEVGLRVAQIGAQLNFCGATLDNEEGCALIADGLTADQSVYFAEGFTAKGEVRLVGAHIGGQLGISGATLANKGGRALTADRLTVNQGMHCDTGFSAKGEVRLHGAQIGGQLGFHGATLENEGGRALIADRLTVEDMYCVGGFTANGEVGLIGAHVAGQLDFSHAILANEGGLALNLDGLRSGALFLGFLAVPRGGVDLANARVGHIYDDPVLWPAHYRLLGFTYETLGSSLDVQQRLPWIESAEGGYQPRVYDQLIAFYHRVGHEEDAREVAIAKQRRRRKELNTAGKVWDSLLDWTIGYGYRTWRAGIGLLAFLGIGWGVFALADMKATKSAAALPGFQPLAYALDVLLPIVDLGQQSAYTPTGIARWWEWFSILVGWVLTTAVVAALSGLLKRD